MKVLVADKLSEEGLKLLSAAKDVEVDLKTGLKPEDLKGIIGQYHGILVRSETKLTADVLQAADNLKVIARAGVGVDNVDVPFASKKGIIVMNTPGGNTTAAAELTVAMMLALARKLSPAHASLSRGEWDRKRFMGTQLSGKVVGVVGLGRIGCEVAKRAAAMEMKVIGYDPYITADKAARLQIGLCESVDALCAQADFISVHTPLSPETRGLVGKAQFELMKPGVRIINCARGGIVSEGALHEAIKSGKVAGAALDVFEKEPPGENPLLSLEQVLATPHLGASTEEAQVQVAVDAAKQLLEALRGGEVRNAVNLPTLDSQQAKLLRPYIALAERMGILLGHLLVGRPETVEISYMGEIRERDVSALTRSFILGLLRPAMEESVNIVNAPVLAEERGIRVSELRSAAASEFSSLISAKVKTDKAARCAAGTVFGREEPRLVNLDGIPVESVLEGSILVVYTVDQPGLIGRIGTMLGGRGINIARFAFGRAAKGGEAIAVLNSDAAVTDDTLVQVEKLADVRAAYSVAFGNEGG